MELCVTPGEVMFWSFVHVVLLDDEGGRGWTGEAHEAPAEVPIEFVSCEAFVNNHIETFSVHKEAVIVEDDAFNWMRVRLHVFGRWAFKSSWQDSDVNHKSDSFS